MTHQRFPAAILLAGLTALLATGCQRQEQIARYTVEKPPPIEAPKNPPPRLGGADAAPVKPGEAKDRTLAAIVPRVPQGWFFKLTGPKDAVEGAAESFATFLKSIRFSSEGKPQWTLPAGWREQPGSQIRYATLVIPGDKPLEVSVTALPNTGEDNAAYVRVNVNRWRGQLRLPPITAEQLAGESMTIDLEGGTATVVNLLGTAEPGGMGRPPFMSGARDGN
jgi:hypothetical protein